LEAFRQKVLIRSFSLWAKGSPAFLPAGDPFLRTRLMQTEQMKESALRCGKDRSSILQR